MTKTRHSYVPFYTDAWLAGTARMPRMVKSVYFDICCYTWDTARKVPDAEIVLMLADTGAQGDQIVEALVKSGKLQRDEEGNVWSERALAEALKALDLWRKKSQGGKGRAANANAAKQKDSSQDSSAEKEKEKEKDSLSGEGKASPSLSTASADEGYGKSDSGDEEEKPVAKSKRVSAGECAEVFAAWNAAAKPLGLSIAQKMTGSREGAIRARIEAEGIERINEALALLPECRFLTGDNDRKWKADLDFFVRPNSITRILEGKYRTGGGGASAWRDME